MKKVILFVLVLALCLSFCSCVSVDEPTKETSKEKTETTDKSTDTGTTAPKNETFGLNETAVFSTLKFTATEIKETNGTQFFKPESGKVFVGVKFTIENISEEEQNVSSILLFDAYSDDVKADYSFSAVCAFDSETLDGTIAPGKKIIGWYALELPSTWKNVELNVKSDWLSNNTAKFVFTK